MAKQTLQARIIEALETLGCKRVACYKRNYRTNKYIVLTKGLDRENFYFVGKNGSLRAGKNVTDSVSLQGVISFDKLFAQAERLKQETENRIASEKSTSK